MQAPIEVWQSWRGRGLSSVPIETKSTEYSSGTRTYTHTYTRTHKRTLLLMFVLPPPDKYAVIRVILPCSAAAYTLIVGTETEPAPASASTAAVTSPSIELQQLLLLPSPTDFCDGHCTGTLGEGASITNCRPLSLICLLCSIQWRVSVGGAREEGTNPTQKHLKTLYNRRRGVPLCWDSERGMNQAIRIIWEFASLWTTCRRRGQKGRSYYQAIVPRVFFGDMPPGIWLKYDVMYRVCRFRNNPCSEDTPLIYLATAAAVTKEN